MITLFQLFTLDQWYKIYNDLTKVSSVAFTCIYILLWVWIGSFVFRNLFVGIMGEYARFSRAYSVDHNVIWIIVVINTYCFLCITPWCGLWNVYTKTFLSLVMIN